METLKFDPETCEKCGTVDCLMRCRHLGFTDIVRAKAEKRKINAGQDSRVLHECLTCYACQEYCPNGNNPFFVLVERQEQRGILPAPVPVVNEQLKMMAPRGKITRRRVQSPVVDLCAFPMLAGSIRGSLFDGVSVISGTDIFCNIMWLHFAKNSTIRERVPQAIDNIMHFYLADSAIDEIVCFHDECYGTYTSVADAYGIRVPFKPVHQFDYLEKKLAALSDRIKPLNVKIAYQRPCSNRLVPQTDKVLDRVFEKIGAQRVPRRYDRGDALCCGGILRAHQRDQLADELVEKNIDDMLAAGAAYCVFNCPFCMATMAQEVAEHGLMPILVSDLCLAALGE
jgi:Fe-S oxidoreductase